MSRTRAAGAWWGVPFIELTALPSRDVDGVLQARWDLLGEDMASHPHDAGGNAMHIAQPRRNHQRGDEGGTSYSAGLVWRRFMQRQALAAWGRLSNHELDDLPLAADMRFTWEGAPDLAVDLHSADELRSWLRDRLFARYPRLRFEIEDIFYCGPPWHVRGATRYRAVQDGEVVYRGVQLTRIRLGKVVEERIITSWPLSLVHRRVPGTTITNEDEAR